MSNRRDRINKAFDKPESQAPDSSLMAVDSIMFSGSNLELDTQRHVVKSLNIFQISPDTTQPRRAMPSEIRALWLASESNTETLFVAWLQKIQESNPEFMLDRYIQPPESEETEESEAAQKALSPVEQSFRELMALAVSIRRDGLTNPITVAKSGENQYQIETGERRWLAYHLLHLYFDGSDGRPDERKKWDKIPARIVEKTSVWRQASENTARQDLNAIGRARQFALLLLDLLSQEGERFKRFDEITTDESDRLYYAQVSDAKAYRVPSGKNEMLLNAMGLSHRSQLSHYRALLSLPDEVWRMGDDYGLPDEFLYHLSKVDAQIAIEEVHKIVVSHSNLTEDEPAEEEKEAKKVGKTLSDAVSYQPGTNRHFAGTVRDINKSGPGKTKQNQKALESIEQLEAWISEHKKRIQEYL